MAAKRKKKTAKKRKKKNPDKPARKRAPNVFSIRVEAKEVQRLAGDKKNRVYEICIHADSRKCVLPEPLLAPSEAEAVKRAKRYIRAALA